SYPANLDTIVVRHKIVDTGGKPMKGNNVRAVATKRIWATDGSLIPFETTARVQADGSYEFELPYVDQPGIHNKGVPFQIIEDVPGKPRHYFIAPVLAHGAGPIDATEALVEAPVGYEVKIQAGPVTDAAAAQLLDQNGQFKAALTGTYATHERLVEVATGQEAALTDSAVAGALSGAGNVARDLLEQRARVTTLPVDVLSYGTDHAAIQAAATDALTSGRQLLFRQATYTMGRIDLPGASGMTIRGDGDAVINLQGADAGFRTWGNVDGFTLSDLSIVGDGTVASNHRGLTAGTNGGTVASKLRNFVVERV